MHLHELFGWPGPMTALQFAVWQEWLAEEWNKPDRHDHYVMQNTAAFLGSKKPPSAFAIPFKRVTKRKSKKKTAPRFGPPPEWRVTEDNIEQYRKALTRSRFGFKN